MPKTEKIKIDTDGQTKVLICLGTGGVAAGARDVYAAFEEELARHNISASVGKRPCKMKKTGCRGLCAMDVLVDIDIPEFGKHTYMHVKPEMVSDIVEQHILDLKPVEKWLTGNDYKEFYAKQQRQVMAQCGIIDPESIEDYIAAGGYSALTKALKMEPEEIIEEVKKSGVRGRGGAGFPTGMKWGFCRSAPGNDKYIIVNADEGDPGAFMDRSLLEGNPHSVMEGLIIGAYAIGCNNGYIYCRAEYPLALHRLEIAIKQAHEHGYLGENILNNGFDFQVHIKEGAGAFVCGEETALMASIEGQRGMPRPRPPFPAHQGLWKKPSNINNVETFANIPLIIKKGGDWYASLGTEKSKGTKIFSLTGKIKNTGLIEVPMGITLKEVVFDICGGVPGRKREFKAAQMGGPSGGCIPTQLIDVPIDYDSLMEAGAIMGSGGVVVMDNTACMVDMARFFLTFTQQESCGKCVPCRIGTKTMLEILNRITEGAGREGDVELLVDLSNDIKGSSLCGLGQTAPNPVLSTIRYYRDEYDAHIREKKCPARSCKALLKFEVIDELCKMCGLCKKNCPVDAILWQPKTKAVIEKDKCIRCQSCIDACPFLAIH
jgi:NADH-quinone oxidoreductase subunit F